MAEVVCYGCKRKHIFLLFFTRTRLLKNKVLVLFTAVSPSRTCKALKYLLNGCVNSSFLPSYLSGPGGELLLGNIPLLQVLRGYPFNRKSPLKVLAT